jgi:hypothetical protein
MMSAVLSVLQTLRTSAHSRAVLQLEILALREGCNKWITPVAARGAVSSDILLFSARVVVTPAELTICAQLCARTFCIFKGEFSSPG